ncbi:MAG TPA: hypothetical protein VJ251_09760, partial [Stellaceae bacterium]|nr:hypothetical protein [Stellaceae bacterium]
PARSDPAANPAAIGCRAPIPAGRRVAVEPLESTDAPGPKSLQKHFALDIGTDPVEANFLVCSLIYATIRGLPPPPGTGAITNERVRCRFAIFWAKTRMGWRETSVDEHRGKPGYRKFYRPYP